MSTTGDSAGSGDQLELADLPPAQARRGARSARRSGPRPAPERARDNPIARVAVDISLPHLDRLFDYTVTEDQSSDARPGVRVRVRFSGQLVDGFIVDRLTDTSHEGRLARLSSVVSPLRVLTPEITQLCRAVADRYAGTMADVIRLAIPPRHATVEREQLAAIAERQNAASLAQPSAPEQSPAGPGSWSRYRSAEGMISSLSSGGAPRAAWCALPGIDDRTPAWAQSMAQAVQATSTGGRGSIVVVPDHRAVSALVEVLGDRGVDAVVLTADQGPRERYRRWLEVLSPVRDDAAPTVVVGTRAAVYAPVRRLGLIAVWDDGNDLHAEPRSPYPHVREVAAQRSAQQECGLIVGGLHRTAEAAAMVQTGFLHSVAAGRTQVRASAPRVRASADATSDGDRLASAARLPTAAWRTAREALERGPVLVQVPRRGYVPRVACVRCGEQARCSDCNGTLSIPRDRETAQCLWCGRSAASWRCPSCGAEGLRAQVVGATRTAEELGRAFPAVTILTSGGRSVRSSVSPDPALVVATPGAEPLAPGGYAGALLLDTWALLGRADLRAAEETLRRWMAAAALVRSAERGGQVVVVADAGVRAVQSLVRWDPIGFAEAELAEREQVGLPPARRVAVLHGAPDDVHDLLSRVDLPDGTERLGPVPLHAPSNGPAGTEQSASQVQVVLRASRRRGLELAAALAAAQGERSVRKVKGWVTVRIDPVGWG